jgi:hypothetical protein
MAFNVKTLGKILKAVHQETGVSMTQFCKDNGLCLSNTQRILCDEVSCRPYSDNLYNLIVALSTVQSIKNRTFDFTPFITEPDGNEMIGYFIGIAYGNELGKIYNKRMITKEIEYFEELLDKIN